MPFNIIRNDITRVKADAIVNTANPDPVIGGGTDTAIYRKAGMNELLEERKKIGTIEPGNVVYTKAFNLNAKYIFHAAGTSWKDGKHGEIEILRKCYSNSLKLAEELKCKSIAFPLMATGGYGFPREKAVEIAIEEISTFWLTNPELKIYLVVFDERSWLLLKERFGCIQTFIDKHYVKQEINSEYSPISGVRQNKIYAETDEDYGASAKVTDLKIDASLEEIVSHDYQTFQQKLLEYIDVSGMKDPEFYHKAHITKQLFSQIRSNVNYKPKKKTAIICGLALELEIDEFVDLLERAGYALTKASMEDKIVWYYVANHNFDIKEINEELSIQNLSLLY